MAFQHYITANMKRLKGMDKLPEHIGYTNTPPPLIEADDNYFTCSFLSLSLEDVHRRDDVEIVRYP